MSEIQQGQVDQDSSGHGVTAAFFGAVTVGALVPGVVGIVNGVASKNLGQACLGAIATIGGLAAAW